MFVRQRDFVHILRSAGHRSPREVSALLAILLFCTAAPRLARGEGDGETIYRERCAPCHGPSGEGVKGEYSRPLTGDKSVASLTRYIDKSMPDDEPEACVGDDAAAVARYIYDAFYSPIAQARLAPPRIELSRLTVRQYRNAVADLVGTFREGEEIGDSRGLRGEYFNSRRPGRDRVLERIDPEVKFEWGPSERDDPVPEELGKAGFAARWEGAVIAPETGRYDIIVRTDQAARLWLNDADSPLIDVWVKSGDETEYRASLFLLAGRAYPLRLEFTSRKQGVDDKKEPEKPVQAFIELWWKTPEGAPEPVPSRQLSPATVPEVCVIDTPFPPDDRSLGWERGTSISKAWDDASTSAAIAAAGYVSRHVDELAGTSAKDGERDAKIHRFAERFVERAFRRALSDAERALYVERQLTAAPDVETAVKRVVLLALKSPRFLFLELDEKPGSAPDGWAIASRLSFALWDSLPDTKLLGAARNGELATREGVTREAERMIRDLRTRAKVRDFLHHWLEIDQTAEIAKDNKRFPEFDPRFASDLRTSLDLFLDDVVWGEPSDFRRLFLSRDLFLNGRLAEYYGFDLPADAPFQKVTANEKRRAGIVSHPYLMARFAYTDTSSPIHRGVFLIRSVLGRVLRPPPEAFTPLAPDLHPNLTTRERVALQTEPDGCQSCHGRINPLGFALEHFDAAGRFRELEGGRPIDASGFLELPSGELQKFEGARELAELLAQSPETHRAFAMQLFHHLIKQPVFAYGADTPALLEQDFSAGGFDVRRLLVSIATIAALEGTPEAAAPPPRRGRRVRL